MMIEKILNQISSNQCGKLALAAFLMFTSGCHVSTPQDINWMASGRDAASPAKELVIADGPDTLVIRPPIGDSTPDALDGGVLPPDSDIAEEDLGIPEDDAGRPPRIQDCSTDMTGSTLLVLFADRIDAYRYIGGGIRYRCRFADLAAHGITDATGMVFDRTINALLIAQPERNVGSIYAFNLNGSFRELAASHQELVDVRGIWPYREGTHVTWSGDTEKFYKWSPADNSVVPLNVGGDQPNINQMSDVTDISFGTETHDTFVPTQSTKEPELFVANSFHELVQPGGDTVISASAAVMTGTRTDPIWVIVTLESQDGPQALLQYTDTNTIEVYARGEVDGAIDLIVLDDRLLVLENGGTARRLISKFETDGTLRSRTPIRGDDPPVMFLVAEVGGDGPPVSDDNTYYGTPCANGVVGFCQSEANFDCSGGVFVGDSCPGSVDVQCCVARSCGLSDGTVGICGPITACEAAGMPVNANNTDCPTNPAIGCCKRI